MKRVLVIGSGASGVHFSLSMLKKGYEVLMLDAGNQRPTMDEPQLSFKQLKSELSDPVGYFLGRDFEGMVWPDSKAEYYGFPPNKAHVFSMIPGFKVQTEGFAPLVSFAQGGLGEVWTGGVYPFNDRELGDFPFGYKDIEPFYNEVAHRIGISGVEDDLSRFMPVHEHLLEPLALDEHSALLLAEYEKHKGFLNREVGCYFGRSRVATLSRDMHGRPGCSYLGRCLWGCPGDAFYTPSITLRECQKFGQFSYLPGLHVSHFRYDAKHRITSVMAKAPRQGVDHEFPVDQLVLAAGTLCSSKIFLESVLRNDGDIIKLPGLMDNRQILVPFLNLKMLGKSYNSDSYQYHQIAFGIEGQTSRDYIHGLITTLKSALVHPILQNTPFGLKTATRIFRYLRAGLGLVNVNFDDSRRQENYLTLAAGDNPAESTLMINYAPVQRERASLQKTIKTVKQVLRRLHCIVPPGMVHVRPMGASVHYAGTIPMSRQRKPWTTSEYCQSHDFENLYIVDGTTFPFLPAKNITFTLMANAVRVAEQAFD